MNLLAKGLTGLMNHSGIKALVKDLALNDPEYHVKITDLSAECTANSINLKAEIQTVLHNNGHSASDTARVGAIMNGFTYNFTGVPATTFYPSIYYHHLDPENTGDVSGTWDTLTATYVIRTVGNRTSPYDVFGALGGMVFSTNINTETLLSTPHWQVVVNTDFPNDWGVDPTGGAAAGPCSCQSTSTGKANCGPSTTPGCGNNCDFHKCTTWERIISWIVSH